MAAVECLKLADALVFEYLKPPSVLGRKRPHRNVASRVPLCLKPCPVFSTKNFYFVCWSSQSSDRVPLSFILALASGTDNSVQLESVLG